MQSCMILAIVLGQVPVLFPVFQSTKAPSSKKRLDINKLVLYNNNVSLL